MSQLQGRSLSDLLRSVLVASDLHFGRPGTYLCLLHRKEYADGGYGQVCARTLDWVRHVPEFQDALAGGAEVDKEPEGPGEEVRDRVYGLSIHMANTSVRNGAAAPFLTPKTQLASLVAEAPPQDQGAEGVHQAKPG